MFITRRATCCRKRAFSHIEGEVPIEKHVRQSVVLHTPAVVVRCRGVQFETTPVTLSTLGPCYLSLQAEIDTSEDINLDFSVESFRVLLDALTVARMDLGKALLYVARNRSTVIDLDALMQFVLLGWVLGVTLRLPPSPTADTPRGDKFGEFRKGFNLRSAYQGESGVFHHLLSSPGQSVIPCCYAQFEAPAFLLSRYEEYVDQVSIPRRGCIPVSIEVDTCMLERRPEFHQSEESSEWEENNRRVSSIYMLQVTLDPSNEGEYVFGDIIMMHAGSCAVFDLGPRCELISEGLVLGMNGTVANVPETHHDMITVDMLSDLDDGRITRLACQPLHFDRDLITYFRFSFPPGTSLGRMFRIRVDPFHPKVGDYYFHEDLMKPLYMLRSVERFGTLLKIPVDICLDKRWQPPFEMEPGVTRLKSKRLRALV